MFSHLFTLEIKRPEVTMKVEDEYLMPNKVAEKGVASKGRSTYQTVNNATNLKDYRSTDFDVANLQEVGAYQMLQPTYLSQLSSMSFADKFQNITLTEDV